MNIALLETLINEGYIYSQKHPSADLYIYNYSPKAQYERLWNEWTLLCRGLIMDSSYQIIARPFQKFFNLEEHHPTEIPTEPFDVYEKMDGSLGILYWLHGKPYIATRGSFNSEQALRATQLLHQRYGSALSHLNPEYTYLFEIIYPTNRIVVNYGDTEDIVLLAIIDKATGQDMPLTDMGFPLVRQYNGIQDIRTLKARQEANKEGFVIRFASGFRVKVKFEEYVRLHRLLTQVSSKTIWEHLSASQPFDELLDKVPDEFYDWVRKTVHDLQNQYQHIETYCQQHFKDLGDRKQTAAYFLSLNYPGILFYMLDKKDYAPLIWKLIKPTYEKPFRTEIE